MENVTRNDLKEGVMGMLDYDVHGEIDSGHEKGIVDFDGIEILANRQYDFLHD
jgi:hypothetical protein